MITKEHVLETFQNVFHHDAQVVAHAPGRINIIGEHTIISNRYLLCTGYRAIMIKKHIVANRQFSIIYRL